MVWLLSKEPFLFLFNFRIDVAFSTYFVNPNWHELWKQEKWAFLIDSMSLAECQNNQIDVNSYLQKSLEVFDKNSADKFWSKKASVWKVPSLMPIRIKLCLCLKMLLQNIFEPIVAARTHQGTTANARVESNRIKVDDYIATVSGKY